MGCYPLPGETITRTLRGVEFGHDRPRDEPAPPEIASYFRAMEAAWDDVGTERQNWLLDHTRDAYATYHATITVYERLHNQLLKVLKHHRDHVYTCDGCRFWLHAEPHGCRREVIKIEEV